MSSDPNWVWNFPASDWRRWSLLIAVCGLTIGLLLSGGCQDGASGPPELRIGHAPHDHHAALFLAASAPDQIRTADGVYLAEREFATRYDLVQDNRILAHLLIDSSTGGIGLIRRLAEDQLDLSFGGVPAMLDQIDQGMPIRILAPAMRDGAGRVVAPELPVTNWSEFVAYTRKREKPLRIGYKASLSVQNLVFEQHLADADIPFSKTPETNRVQTDVQVVLINLSGPQNLVPALDHGLIDGFVSMQPYLALAQSSRTGRQVALISGIGQKGASGVAYPCCAIAARDAILVEHPALVEQFLALMRIATERLIENPAAHAEIVARWLGTTPELERRSLPTTNYLAEPDADWHQGMMDWIGLLRGQGILDALLTQPLDANRLLERIDPRAAATEPEGRNP